MAFKASVTVLVDNTVRGRDLLGEHGISFWIEWGDKHFLFDAGAGTALAHNARQLRAELSQVDGVVFSHGHYDHTGGILEVLEAGARPRIYAHPAAFGPKLVQRADGQIQEIGIPQAALAAIRSEKLEVIETERVLELAPGLFVTGEIPRHTDFEERQVPFLKDTQGTIDPLSDDQAVFFDTEEGLVVLVGCAHAGAINTVRHVESYLSGKRVDTLLGGLHLGGASPRRLEETIKALKEIAPRRLGPAHCTGMRATARLWHEMPESCIEVVVGSRWAFNAKE
jgi:7,8-dihydropterin-6-yl-methyl-4-(beta-D-ribofuranosyl)aminobenzene 5'-phosphate synthase